VVDSRVVRLEIIACRLFKLIGLNLGGFLVKI
jgi:hypothetical protein